MTRYRLIFVCCCVNFKTIPGDTSIQKSGLVLELCSSCNITDDFYVFRNVWQPAYFGLSNPRRKKTLNFNSNNEEDYNKPFSLTELLNSLEKCHDTAPGSDQIHYQLLKHLPQESLEVFLEIYNITWITGNFPESLTEALVVLHGNMVS